MIKKPIFYGEKTLQEIFSKDEITCILKVSKGTANEYEQKMAYKYIVEKLCRIAQNAFNSDPQITSFNEGVRFVGTMLAQAVTIDVDDFRQKSIINQPKSK